MQIIISPLAVWLKFGIEIWFYSLLFNTVYNFEIKEKTFFFSLPLLFFIYFLCFLLIFEKANKNSAIKRYALLGRLNCNKSKKLIRTLADFI